MIKNKLTLTNSIKKQGRGQMAYAPISQNIHKSNTNIANNPYLNNINQAKLTKNANQTLDLIKQLQIMQKINEQLRNKEELYINKLLRLEEGLQKQHLQFMNLQELYTELFQSYKLKEQEVSELQQRYRQTQRKKHQEDFSQKDRAITQITKNIQPNNDQKVLKDNIRQLEANIKFLNQKNERLLSEISYFKSKNKLVQSRCGLQEKIFQELQVWQKQADQQKQHRIKLQYENDFLKTRNQDLEKDVQQLQKMIKFKQNQIIKMREDKINFRRQSSEKILNKSPSKGAPIDSSRNRNSSQQKKKLTNLIQNLQQENQKLRDQLVDVKQSIRNQENIPPRYHPQNQSFSKSSFAYQLTESQLSKDESFRKSGVKQSGTRQVLGKKLNFNQQNLNESKAEYGSRPNNAKNYNSQTQQYFSFSQDKEEKQSENQSFQLNKNINEQDLPIFPGQLQIDQLIKQHKK